MSSWIKMNTLYIYIYIYVYVCYVNGRAVSKKDISIYVYTQCIYSKFKEQMFLSTAPAKTVATNFTLFILLLLFHFYIYIFQE